MHQFEQHDDHKLQVSSDHRWQRQTLAVLCHGRVLAAAAALLLLAAATTTA